MIPIFVPSESDSQPWAFGIESEEGAESVLELGLELKLVLMVVLGESFPVSLVAGGGAEATAVAIGPTLMVVNELGCSGSS